MIGSSKAFRQMLNHVNKVAKHPWPVLIAGETGVGKELVAQHLHQLSDRKHQPFVPINCGALPPTLFESELFGHEKGSYSGALNHNKGLLRSARGGSVFLDEIGDLDLALQVKLLRFLESGEVRSVGSQRIEQVPVRIIAATNKNLEKLILTERFRLDLYERLCVLKVDIPPLRERKEDLKELSEYFLEQFNSSLEPQTIETLKNYDWPGNIRELRNVLMRAVVQGEGKVRSTQVSQILSSKILRLQNEKAEEGTLAEIEKRVIVRRLKLCDGNRKRTAKELGIAKSTLHEKLRQWKEDSQAWPISRYNDDEWLRSSRSHSTSGMGVTAIE